MLEVFIHLHLHDMLVVSHGDHVLLDFSVPLDLTDLVLVIVSHYGADRFVQDLRHIIPQIRVKLEDRVLNLVDLARNLDVGRDTAFLELLLSSIA